MPENDNHMHTTGDSAQQCVQEHSFFACVKAALSDIFYEHDLRMQTVASTAIYTVPCTCPRGELGRFSLPAPATGLMVRHGGPSAMWESAASRSSGCDPKRSGVSTFRPANRRTLLAAAKTRVLRTASTSLRNTRFPKAIHRTWTASCEPSSEAVFP